MVVLPRSGCSRAAVIGLALLGVAACGASAAPLVERLESAPLPEGAVKISGEARDGDFERGPHAELEYSLAAPLSEVCLELLAQYLAGEYTLVEYVGSAAITNPDTWCAEQLDPTVDDSVNELALIVVVFPPGASTGYSTDGFSAILTRARADDPHPKGTHLRLSSG